MFFNLTMTINKTTRVQHDTTTKNKFIGAMEAMGKLCQSASKYGIKSSTASDIWTKYKNTGTTKNCLRSGRPPKLTDCAQRLVVWNCVKNHQKPFQQIAKDTNIDISERIIHNTAVAAGYHRRVAQKVPFLTAHQKRKRVAWAEEFKSFDIHQWKNLIWSDECYVHLDDNSGHVYVTCHEEYDENCVIPTFKQSSVWVMVWGCIFFMKGRKGRWMTGERYISQVLKAHLHTFSNQMKEERPEVVFQQDGARPSHTSKLAKLEWWLADPSHGISVFPHLPSSPDVNPIEPVRHELKKIIRALPHSPTTVPKLIKAVHDAWDALEIPDIDKYIDTTVPFRIVWHGLWPVTTAPKFCFGRCQWDAWQGWVPAFGMLKFRPFVQPFLEFLCDIYVTAGQHQCDSWPQPISAPSGGSVTRDLPNNSKWYSMSDRVQAVLKAHGGHFK